jgi:hypothetical protein
MLRQSSNWTKPGAKGFLEQEAHKHEGNKENRRGRMDPGHASSEQKILRIHQPCDGQPSFDACRPWDVHPRATALAIANPEEKLDAQPTIQRHEKPLNNAPDPLVLVVVKAADKLLFLFLFPDWRYCFFAHIELTFCEKRKPAILDVKRRVMGHIARQQGNSDKDCRKVFFCRSDRHKVEFLMKQVKDRGR